MAPVLEWLQLFEGIIQFFYAFNSEGLGTGQQRFFVRAVSTKEPIRLPHRPLLLPVECIEDRCWDHAARKLSIVSPPFRFANLRIASASIRRVMPVISKPMPTRTPSTHNEPVGQCRQIMAARTMLTIPFRRIQYEAPALRVAK